MEVLNLNSTINICIGAKTILSEDIVMSAHTFFILI